MSGPSDYEVGYGRPPKHTQFKPGASGNPAGRAKGPPSVGGSITAALAEHVVVNQNGQRRSISKLDAALTQMANKAAGGDRHAVKLMVELLQRSQAQDEARAAGVSVGPEDRKASDRAILAAICANARQAGSEAPDDSGH